MPISIRLRVRPSSPAAHALFTNWCCRFWRLSLLPSRPDSVSDLESPCEFSDILHAFSLIDLLFMTAGEVESLTAEYARKYCISVPTACHTAWAMRILWNGRDGRWGRLLQRALRAHATRHRRRAASEHARRRRRRQRRSGRPRPAPAPRPRRRRSRWGWPTIKPLSGRCRCSSAVRVGELAAADSAAPA